ncbi:MAG: hypothetical protein IT229_03595 [Flavobacteriales bacterium]|nr:hypothetical protein [Flavobacteriales bacterium]
MRKILLLFLALNTSAASLACSCMGNNSYCETLGPQQFLNPDATALVVKLSDYYYGITVKVVQNFGGSSLPNDTLTVWGDNGALCRIGVNGVAVGDTMVFGLNETDFSGNTIWNSQYPPDLEESGHYMVSVCGVYALNFINGMVVGWITAPVTQSMTIGEFETVLIGCATETGVEDEHEADPLVVRYESGVPVFELTGPTMDTQLLVHDVRGQLVLSIDRMNGPYRSQGLAVGSYLVTVKRGDRSWVRRVAVLE